MKRITVSAPLRLFARGSEDREPRLFKPGAVYEVSDELARNSYLARFIKTSEDIPARRKARRKTAEESNG